MQKVDERIGQNSPVAETRDVAVEQEGIPKGIEDVNELMRLRRLKLVQLQEKGIEPYGERFEKTHPAVVVVENYEAYEGQRVIVAGRLLGRRGHGKTTFADLQDESGRIQIYLRQNDV
jgi:Lysyl-tRNA synthetase (class II)